MGLSSACERPEEAGTRNADMVGLCGDGLAHWRGARAGARLPSFLVEPR